MYAQSYIHYGGRDDRMPRDGPSPESKALWTWLVKNMSNFRAAGFLGTSKSSVGARCKHLGYKTSEASP